MIEIFSAQYLPKIFQVNAMIFMSKSILNL